MGFISKMDYYLSFRFFYHYSLTHDDKFVTLFRKSPLVTLLPLAFEYKYVDIFVRVCSIQLLKNHNFAAFLRFQAIFYTHLHSSSKKSTYLNRIKIVITLT